MLKPKIILHQNSTLLRMVLLRIHRLRWTKTIGICNIMATKPYPRNLRVIQPMTSSCAILDTRKVMKVATGRDIVFRDAEYTWRRKK